MIDGFRQRSLNMQILVGDLGGTHTRLACAELREGRVSLSQSARYLNSEHASLDVILGSFLDTTNQTSPTAYTSCCLAVAGPTNGDSVQFTNLDWQIDAAALTKRFGFGSCRLVNDFAAVGWGMNILAEDALSALQIGEAIPGAARVALGAGTGLGVSLCAWCDNHYYPMASEGGHVSFAPLDSEQDRLLAFFRARHKRVSVERILSGPGLVDLYRFCLAELGQTASVLLQSEQPAEAISRAGLEQTDPVAAHCLRLFGAIYGQTAGDWALALQARGGVYLAGGIAPKLLPVLQSDAFLDGFHAKGRYSEWMKRIPVLVILDADIGLKGAAFVAARTLF
jgi:glucokinase